MSFCNFLTFVVLMLHLESFLNDKFAENSLFMRWKKKDISIQRMIQS